MWKVAVDVLVTSVSEDTLLVVEVEEVDVVEEVDGVELLLVVDDVEACRATIPSAMTARYPDPVMSVKVTGRLTKGEDVIVYSEGSSWNGPSWSPIAQPVNTPVFSSEVKPEP
jgi:hypothetical protein